MTFHPSPYLCWVECKSVGNQLGRVRRKRLESGFGLLLPPLVSRPHSSSPARNSRRRPLALGPDLRAEALASRPAPRTFSLRVAFPGGRRAVGRDRPGHPGHEEDRPWATMAWQSIPVPRLEGVSQEQFTQQLYPQVRPSGRPNRREPGNTRPYHPGRSELVSWDLGYGEEAAGGWRWPFGRVARGESTWGMSNGSSVKFFWENSYTFSGSRMTAETWVREIACLISTACCGEWLSRDSLVCLPPLPWQRGVCVGFPKV